MPCPFLPHTSQEHVTAAGTPWPQGFAYVGPPPRGQDCFSLNPANSRQGSVGAKRTKWGGGGCRRSGGLSNSGELSLLEVWKGKGRT